VKGSRHEGEDHSPTARQKKARVNHSQSKSRETSGEKKGGRDGMERPKSGEGGQHVGVSENRQVKSEGGERAKGYSKSTTGFSEGAPAIFSDRERSRRTYRKFTEGGRRKSFGYQAKRMLERCTQNIFVCRCHIH